MPKKHYTTALTIAGSDNSGGAGIQADLKTFSALGCYGMSVITALTAQNTQGVTAIQSVPVEFIQHQLTTIINDMPIHAVKIGMLHNADIIKTIAEHLEKFASIPVVLDPVMIAKSGHALLEPQAIEQLRKLLLPRVTLITPNIAEAELLLGQKVQSPKAMLAAAKKLCSGQTSAVIIKGGHLNGDESSDVLYIRATDQFHWFTKPRVNTRNTHGTGCTFSSAITAFLAKGYDLVTAVEQAKTYITDAIARASEYQLGAGHGPVHHFYKIWTDE